MRKINLGDSRLLLVAEAGQIVDSRSGKEYSEIGINESEQEFYHDDMNEELKAAKADMLAEIEAYDKSSNVNGFLVNGITAWLDRETRMSVMNSTNIQIAAGMEETTLWLENHPFKLPCSAVVQMLSVLELYALECYNVTAQHVANVMGIDSVEDIIGYDYTAGYPDKLTFEV